MNALFITASGTEIGKTFVTRLLIGQLQAAGRRVGAIKPVISGFDSHDCEQSDTALILDALGRARTDENLAAISPWRFAAPLSPDMAAAREGRTLPFDDLLAFCRQEMAAHDDVLLIEGVGGVMVPLDPHHTVRDWIRALNIPALVVGGSYLGAISHSLSSLEALAVKGIPVRGLIVSETPDSPVACEETANSLRHFTDVPVSVLHRPPGDANLIHLLS